MSAGASGDRLRITCPACGAVASAPVSAAGRSVRCGRCDHLFRAPAASAPPSPEPVAAAVAAAGSEAAPTVPEDAADAAPGSEPPPGDGEWRVGDVVLGLYEVSGVLGQGGMGRVYRVHHRGWGVDLAVKTPLRRALEAAGGPEMFEREAETWVNLGLHPHVVSCYYVRRVDGLPRVFAEYVDGGSLQHAIRDRHLTSAAAALDIAIQFAWGLHYAHEQGLVHRDVKPGNVLLAANGVAKVTDFGLAGARVTAAQPGAGGEQTTMAPGGGGGTPAYMSPEQWSGQPLTRRTDVWSWAASVLEIFLGRREWELGPAARAAVESCLASPHGWALPLPPAAAELLLRCLQDDVDRRPRTLAEAADGLAAAHAALTRRHYARPRPAAGRDTADSLNNRAVSLIDLGRSGADALWAQALRADPQHLESSYNQAMHAWTHGRIGDEELLARVQAARSANPAAARGSELAAHARQAVEGRPAAEAVLLKLDQALAVAVAPGSRRILALGRQSSDVRVWTADGEPLRPVLLTDLAPRALAPTPDGAAVLVGGEGGPPQLCPLDGSHSPRSLARYPGITNAVAVTADGRLAIAAGSDRVVRVFELESGRLMQALEGHADAITCVALDARGRFAATGGVDGSVRVWDLGTAAALHIFEAHRGRVAAVALSRDGGVLLSAGDDRGLRHWDPARGTAVRTILGPSAPLTGIVLSEDGREAYVSSLDRSLRLWDLGTGTLRGTLRLGAPIAAMAGAGASVWLATSSGLREVRPESLQWQPPYAVARPLSVREVEHRQATFLHRASAARQAVTEGDLARALSLAREARSVPGHERSAEALTLWDEVTARFPHAALLAAWEAAKLEGHRDPVVSVAVSADGHRALSGDLAGGARFWDLHQLGPAGALEAHEACVAAVALSADGRTALTASWDRRVKMWDFDAGRLRRVLEGHDDYVNGLALSPSGRTALTASSDHTLRLWDLGSGRELGVLQGHDAAVSGCAFGPDGRFAISGSWDGTVRLWDVESRQPAGILEGHEAGVASVAIGADGLRALSGGMDGTLRTWDLRLRRPLRTLESHASEVTTVAVLPDGRHAVSASRDKTVRVWDLAREKALRTLPHTGAVLSVAALPSGNGLLCGGTDLALTLWRLDWEADARSMRATVVTAPTATVRPEASSAWEEIRRAAPRAGAREAAVHVARSARRRLPAPRTLAAAAVLALAVAGAVLVLRPRREDLGFSRHQGARVRQDLAGAVVTLSATGGCAEGGYEEYLQLARARVASESTLACLFEHRHAGVVDAFLRDLSFHDPEPRVADRRRRNATSFLAALGDEGVASACPWLRAPDEAARIAVSRALAAIGTPAALECLTAAAGDPDPRVRSVAAHGIRFCIAKGLFDAPQAWALAGRLAADADPVVRTASVPVLGMFDFEHASAALARLEKDSDPGVAAEARRYATLLRRFKNLNPDLPY